MNLDIIYMELAQGINKENILRDEPMKNHTSFKIGGPADILITPESVEEIVYSINYCRNNRVKYYVIGNGSNLLVRDKGIRGVVIKIAESFSNITIEDTIVKAQAGVLLSRLSKIIMAESLEGFEFASGIPGTLGGAITMNAGAYGGEMKDVVKGITCIDEKGKVIYLDNKDIDFGYRRSIVQDKGYIVLEVEMELVKGDYGNIKKITDELTHKRTSKQPLHLPSAGSTFKRPEGYYAAKLIDDSDLRGVRFGDAQVSEKHCGFIVNVGNANAEQVLSLIKLVQKVVKDKYNVELDTEVRIIGDE